LLYAPQALAVEFVSTFAEFPPVQHAASFTIDDAIPKLEQSSAD
jgi:arylsulfatase